jgi:hypothetical protein
MQVCYFLVASEVVTTFPCLVVTHEVFRDKTDLVVSANGAEVGGSALFPRKSCAAIGKLTHKLACQLCFEIESSSRHIECRRPSVE